MKVYAFSGARTGYYITDWLKKRFKDLLMGWLMARKEERERETVTVCVCLHVKITPLSPTVLDI